MTTERYVRLCPEHRHALTDGGQDARGAEIVSCPRGHRARAWDVFDRVGRQLLARVEQDPAERLRCAGWPKTSCRRVIRVRNAESTLCLRCRRQQRRDRAFVAQAEAGA